MMTRVMMTRRWPRTALLLAIAGAAMGLPARVLAQAPAGSPPPLPPPGGQPSAAPTPGGAGSQAPGEDPKEAAKAKLLEGGKLLQQGDYVAALGLFKEAYALFPSPKIFYNFGLAYMELGRKADAIEAFERFLAEANDANPENLVKAAQHRKALAEQTAAVTFTCNKNGAEISIDGKSHGVTPPRGPVRLDAGTHQLVVEKAGSLPYAQRITVTAGQKLTVDVQLADQVVDKPDDKRIDTGPVAPADTGIPGRGWKWKAAWGTGIAAVALLGLGVVEQIVASSKYSDFNSYDAPYGGSCDTDPKVREHGGGECSSLLSSGDSAHRLALIGFIGGSVLAAGSVALFTLSFLEKRAADDAAAAAPMPPTVSVTCTPSLLPQHAGASCALRF
jgi:Tfp pilus assembly protein PilF